MTDGHNTHQIICSQHQGTEGMPGWSAVYDGQINLIIIQHIIKIIYGIRNNRYGKIIVSIAAAGQHFRDQITFGGVCDADADLGQLFSGIVDLCFHFSI